MAGVVNRIPTGKVKEFLTNEKSAQRNKLLEYVKNSLSGIDDSVVLCFRGSSASLYYHCHLLLRIHYSRKKRAVVGEFNFRHSRFTENYIEIKKRLAELGVDFSEFDENEKSRCYVNFALTGDKAVEPNALEEILRKFCSLIDDFFDPCKKTHQYDIPAKPKGKSCNREKNRQQQIYTKYFYDPDKTYYDFEYCEHDGKRKNVPGRFDLLGIVRDEGGYSLLLSELKTTKEACTGSASVESHACDYLGYYGSQYIAERKKEAAEVVRLLHELLGKPYPVNLNAEDMGVKIEFIFTDEAAPFGKKYDPPQGIETEVLEF